MTKRAKAMQWAKGFTRHWAEDTAEWAMILSVSILAARYVFGVGPLEMGANPLWFWAIAAYGVVALGWVRGGRDCF